MSTSCLNILRAVKRYFLCSEVQQQHRANAKKVKELLTLTNTTIDFTSTDTYPTYPDLLRQHLAALIFQVLPSLSPSGIQLSANYRPILTTRPIGKRYHSVSI
jgi:hypothetical protein